MTNKKISEMASLLAGDVADGDYIPIIDISEEPGLQNKKILISDLRTAIGATSGGGTTYDAESEAFFTAEGITVTADKNAIDTLVKGLKADSTWPLLDALWLFFGNTHKFNLKNAADLDSAYRLLFTGGWTHDATGSKGNGTTGYANTFITPSLTFAADNSHIGAWLAGAGPAGSEILIGANTDTLSTRLGRGGNGSTPSLTGEIDAFGATGITTISAGHYIVSRKVSTSIDLFKDGAFVASPVKTSVGRVDKPLFIGASNNWFSGSQVISDFSASTFKLAHAGKGLTNTQATALYNRLLTFLNAIGR